MSSYEERVKNIRRELGFARVRNQMLAAVVANIGVFGQGCNIGWFSPTLPMLRSADTVLASGPLGIDEVGWMGALSPLGAMTGSLLFGTMTGRCGFKRVLMLCMPLLAVSWLLLIYAQSSWHLLASRFLLGVSGGGTFLCIPQYVAEIADDFIRGQLNSYMMMIFYIGVLFGYIGGSYLEYYTNMWLNLAVPVLFCALFAFMPETPQFLLRKNRVAEAERSIRFYRNCRAQRNAAKDEEDALQAEFEKFQAIARQNSAVPDVRAADLCTPAALYAFTVTVCLIFVNQWSGSFIMNNYAVTIFAQSGSHIDANVASIVMGMFQVCGNYAASQLMDRIGRRTLHIISTAGASVSLLVTGAYVYLVRVGVDMAAYSLVPVASLSFFIFICAIGVIPVPFIVMTEVMPARIRKLGVSVCSCMSFALQFAIFKLFPMLLEALELYGCMWLFAGVTTFGLLFSVFVVKETKGKNLDVLSGAEAPTKAIDE